MSDQEKSFEGAKAITLDAAATETAKKAYELALEAVEDQKAAAAEAEAIAYLEKVLVEAVEAITKAVMEAAETIIEALFPWLIDEYARTAEAVEKCLEQIRAAQEAGLGDRRLPRPPRRIDATAAWSGRHGGRYYSRSRNREHRDKRKIGGGNT